MFNDLARFFADLEGFIDEKTRAGLVRRFCRMVTLRMKDEGDTATLRDWLTRGKAQFIRDCGIADGLGTVPETLKVEKTPLAHFCSDWISANKYRRTPDSKWRRFTLEQNHLRVAMVAQLANLAKGNPALNLTTVK